jgi:hypothetical protein
VPLEVCWVLWEDRERIPQWMPWIKSVVSVTPRGLLTLSRLCVCCYGSTTRGCQGISSKQQQQDSLDVASGMCTVCLCVGKGGYMACWLPLSQATCAAAGTYILAPESEDEKQADASLMCVVFILCLADGAAGQPSHVTLDTGHTPVWQVSLFHS